MAFWQYALGSSALTAVLVLQALAVYPNYFAAFTALSANSVTLLVLAQQFMLLLWLLGKLVLYVSFGELRLAEVEKIYQRVWPLAIDGVVMATSLKMKHSGLSLGLTLSFIGFLLVVHWVLNERVLVLYQMMEFPSRSRQIRIFTLAATLVWVDVVLFKYMWSQIIRSSHMHLLICPFFIDMLSVSISSLCRLVVDFAEVYVVQGEDDEDDEWEAKNTILFVTGFTVHVLALTAYAANFYLVGSISFHLFFGLMEKGRKVYTLVTEFYQSMQAKRMLNLIVDDASEVDIGRDNLCVICREEMLIDATTDSMKPKRMHCGHVIHFSCLKSWLNRAQHCPTCRQPVKQATSAFGSNQTQNQPQDYNQAADQADVHPQPVAVQQQPAQEEQRPLRPPSAGPDTASWHKLEVMPPSTGQLAMVKIGETYHEFQVI